MMEHSPRFPASHCRPSDPLRPWLASIWVLVFVYFVAGVFGRSLWKADEPYSFGIVWEMLKDHQWLIPHIAGQPFVEKPPLVYWIAAAFAEALPTLRPDESARLAVLLFAAIGVGALYAAAKRLHREAATWFGFVGSSEDMPSWPSGGTADLGPHAYATLGLLVMIGTLGFAEHIHKLTADIGQLAGAILGLCGMIYIGTSGVRNAEAHEARRSGIVGGAMLGTGTGIAFLSKGLLVPGLLSTTCALLLLLPDYRSRTARLGFAIAVAAVLPWLVIWPALFHSASPDLFREWLWGNNVGRFVGSTLLGGNHRTLANKLGSIVFAGLPTVLLLPLVVWRILRAAVGNNRGDAWKFARGSPGHAGLALFLVISVVVLATSASMRDIYVLPLLPAIVLLGLPALLLTPRSSSNASRRFPVIAFAALTAMVAIVWIELVTTGNLAGLPGLARLVGRTLPLPYRLAISWPAILVAVGTIVAWAYIVRRDVLRSPTVAWCAGFAMTWVITAALLLPWIDAARSYQGVFGEIAPQVSSFRRCVATLNMGESEVSMLEYVTGIEATREYLGHSGSGIRAEPNPAARDCDWLIALSNQRSGRVRPDSNQWRPVRTVSRPADRNERITLYRAAQSRDPHPTGP
jgi:4-amino-4-deoxy-L-arabinose transferase-like glycosyltransferase